MNNAPMSRKELRARRDAEILSRAHLGLGAPEIAKVPEVRAWLERVDPPAALAARAVDAYYARVVRDVIEQAEQPDGSRVYISIEQGRLPLEEPLPEDTVPPPAAIQRGYVEVQAATPGQLESGLLASKKHVLGTVRRSPLTPARKASVATFVGQAYDEQLNELRAM